MIRRLIARWRSSSKGRSWIRLVTSVGEGFAGAAFSGFIAAYAMLFLLLLALGFLEADVTTMSKFGVVVDSLSAIALIALTIILVRVELARERAEFQIDEVRVHTPPPEHDPDQLEIAFRVINTGARDSVIWQKKSAVRGFDRFGSEVTASFFRVPVASVRGWWARLIGETKTVAPRNRPQTGEGVARILAQGDSMANSSVIVHDVSDSWREVHGNTRPDVS